MCFSRLVDWNHQAVTSRDLNQNGSWKISRCLRKRVRKGAKPEEIFPPQMIQPKLKIKCEQKNQSSNPFLSQNWCVFSINQHDFRWVPAKTLHFCLLFEVIQFMTLLTFIPYSWSPKKVQKSQAVGPFKTNPPPFVEGQRFDDCLHLLGHRTNHEAEGLGRQGRNHGAVGWFVSKPSIDFRCVVSLGSVWKKCRYMWWPIYVYMYTSIL